MFCYRPIVPWPQVVFVGIVPLYMLRGELLLGELNNYISWALPRIVRLNRLPLQRRFFSIAIHSITLMSQRLCKSTRAGHNVEQEECGDSAILGRLLYLYTVISCKQRPPHTVLLCNYILLMSTRGSSLVVVCCSQLYHREAVATPVKAPLTRLPPQLFLHKFDQIYCII